jgi:hypothetical protein
LNSNLSSKLGSELFVRYEKPGRRGGMAEHIRLSGRICPTRPDCDIDRLNLL